MENSKLLATFCINYSTQPGQVLYVVGSSTELGCWDIAQGLKLTWHDVQKFSTYIMN